MLADFCSAVLEPPIFVPQTPVGANIPLVFDLPGLIKSGEVENLNTLLLGPLTGIEKIPDRVSVRGQGCASGCADVGPAGFADDHLLAIGSLNGAPIHIFHI